jgi:hypothetical protein
MPIYRSVTLVKVLRWYITNNMVVFDRVEFCEDVHVRWRTVSVYTCTIGCVHPLDIRL